MLKPIFDSAGDLDSREYDVLTLGGYVAEYQHWRRIEREWLKAVLWAWSKCRIPPGEHPLFHMTELMSFSNPFSRRNGWDEGLRDALLQKCLDVVKRACAREHIHAVSATVVLKDFKAVQHLSTTPPLQLSCGGFCLGHALARDCIMNRAPESGTARNQYGKRGGKARNRER
ncbi:MAG TPA: hypothetical protein VLA42_04710 [Verrucomicrobiae bacterium]|nr:hypothetical protein [Verrucomicrobiae bacterium]